MNGIVPETHWLEQKLAAIRHEVESRHREQLEHPDPAVRKQVKREAEAACRDYLSRSGRAAR